VRRIEPHFRSWLVPQIAGANIHLAKTVNAFVFCLIERRRRRTGRRITALGIGTALVVDALIHYRR